MILILHNLEKEDLTLCGEIFSQVFTSKPFYFNWVTFDVAFSYMNELYNTPYFKGFKLVIENKVVGFCLGTYNEHLLSRQYHIKEIFILPSVQNNGFGTVFLNSIESYLKENNVIGITLYTNKNIDAYNFYLKNDYSVMKESVHLMKLL